MLTSNSPVTMSAAATTTSLQKPPLTPHSPSPQTYSINPPNLSFSNNLTLPLKLKTRSLRRTAAKMSNSAAGSYATALADLARSNGTLESTANDIEHLHKLFSNKSVLNFFTSPIVSLEQKRELIDEIASSGILQPHVCNFINVLIERKRMDLIDEIVKEFEIAYNRLTGTEMAMVTSVVALEKQHLAQMAKQVQRLTGARNVRIKTRIDESLVAGFTIRFGNAQSKLIDMSVKKQLEDIAKEVV